MTDDTERQLLEYLHEQRTSDISGTLKTIVNWTTSHEAKDDVRHQELVGDLRGLSLRVGAVEKDLDRTDDRLDQSGAWQVEVVKARAILAETSASTWRGHTVTVVVGLVMLAVGGVASLLFHK